MIPATTDFLLKARRTLRIILGELPPCCARPAIA
jgi:hypothetical protein